MTDFHSILDAGVIGEYINTVVEIPKGSMHKIEYSMDQKIFVLDRVEPEIFAKPVNYGFIPQTLDGDGDALDTLIITEEPLSTGILVKARVIAVLNFMDDGEKDSKIICVPADDRNMGNSIKSLADLTDAWKARIEHHFNHYKDLKKAGSTKVDGFGDEKKAWEVIEECIARFKK